MADRIKILRNVYKKLDSLPLGFGVPAYSDDIADTTIEKTFGIDIDDTLREIRMKIGDIESDSVDELNVEDRTVYHALRRFRMSSAIYYKFSTAVDGKTIDKSMIPKMISTIIMEYDQQFKRWRSGGLSKLWNRSVVSNAQ
jgi:hypothetical protein